MFLTWDKSNRYINRVENKNDEYLLEFAINKQASVINSSTVRQQLKGMNEELEKYQENLNQFTGCIKPYSLMDLYGLYKLVSKFTGKRA